MFDTQLEKGAVRPRGTDSAKVISVIQTTALCGSGIEGDPLYEITQYWTFDGVLIGERPHAGFKRSLDKDAEGLRYPNINAERTRLGLSWEQMAEQLGVTRKTVYNWITKGHIPEDKLYRMADLFNCSVDYLLQAENKIEKETKNT